MTLHKTIVRSLIKYFPNLFSRYYREYREVSIEKIEKKRMINKVRILNASSYKLHDDEYHHYINCLNCKTEIVTAVQKGINIETVFVGEFVECPYCGCNVYSGKMRL